MFPGAQTRMDSLREQGRAAAVIVVGAVLMLFIAGLIEGVFRQTVTSVPMRLRGRRRHRRRLDLLLWLRRPRPRPARSRHRGRAMRPVVSALRVNDNAQLVREIVTPEGIPIRFTLARAGDRAAAFAIDMVIQIVLLVAVGLGLRSAVGDTGTWLTAAIVVLVFVLLNFYFALFEIRWQGATPGKRKIGIRVIDARGGQLETSAVLARNLIRELEVWIPLRLLLLGSVVWPDAPGWARLIAAAWAVVFLFMPVFNKDRLRIGDMIAGTRVVMQPKLVLVPDLVDQTAADAATAAAARRVIQGTAARPASAEYSFSDAQLSIYGIYELQVLEGVLRINPGDPAHLEVLRTVSDKVRAKIRYEPNVVDHDRFLREFYSAQRAHLEQKLLFGQRRQDKFSR